MHDNSLLQLPHIRQEHLQRFAKAGVPDITTFINTDPVIARKHLQAIGLSHKQEADVCRAAQTFPVIDVRLFYDVECEDEDEEPTIKVA